MDISRSRGGIEDIGVVVDSSDPVVRRFVVAEDDIE